MLPSEHAPSYLHDGRKQFYKAMMRLYVCRKCGRSGAEVQMDLDHIDAAAMVCRISDFFYRRSRHVTWEVVANEMLKVQPLCRPCHMRKNGPIDIGQLELFTA